jgi:ribosomal protein L34
MIIAKQGSQIKIDGCWNHHRLKLMVGTITGKTKGKAKERPKRCAASRTKEGRELVQKGKVKGRRKDAQLARTKEGRELVQKENVKERPKDVQPPRTKEGKKLIPFVVGSYLTQSPSNVGYL